MMDYKRIVTVRQFDDICAQEECAVARLASNLKYEGFFMLVKFGAMVTSKQAIYGKKAITVVNIMK